MLTRAHRENIFMILSSKLEKEDAIGLEKDISIFILELEREHIKSYINVNKLLMEGRIKKGIREGDDFSEGAYNILEIKNQSFTEEIQFINENIIKILK